MPRQYQKTGLRQKYSTITLKTALCRVQRGEISQREAERQYKIPRRTLREHIADPNLKYGSGRATDLSHAEEELLVTAIIAAGEYACPMEKSDILDITEEYVASLAKKTRFKNNRPGDDWFYGFTRRWMTELAPRKPEVLTISRATSCNEFVISKFFDILEQKVDELGIRDSPAQIINLDETGFVTDPKCKRVFVKKGKRNPSVVIPGSGKEMYTVLGCVAANGKVFPPYILYKAKNLYDSWCVGGPYGAGYSTTDSGWMEGTTLASWFEKRFLYHVRHIKKPILVLFDGHSSHITVDLITTAKAHDVHLLCMPPHCSHVLQPLDVGVFGPAKKDWSKILKRHYKGSRLKSVDKSTFPGLLKQLYAKAFRKEHVISGFMKSGIYPVDRHAIPTEKLLPAKVFFRPDTDTCRPTS